MSIIAIFMFDVSIDFCNLCQFVFMICGKMSNKKEKNKNFRPANKSQGLRKRISEKFSRQEKRNRKKPPAKDADLNTSSITVKRQG